MVFNFVFTALYAARRIGDFAAFAATGDVFGQQFFCQQFKLWLGDCLGLPLIFGIDNFSFDAGLAHLGGRYLFAAAGQKLDSRLLIFTFGASGVFYGAGVAAVHGNYAGFDFDHRDFGFV